MPLSEKLTPGCALCIHVGLLALAPPRKRISVVIGGGASVPRSPHRHWRLQSFDALTRRGYNSAFTTATAQEVQLAREDPEGQKAATVRLDATTVVETNGLRHIRTLRPLRTNCFEPIRPLRTPVSYLRDGGKEARLLRETKVRQRHRYARHGRYRTHATG